MVSVEMIETKVNEIINKLESITNLPVYRDLKVMDDVEEFIVIERNFYESVWSNDTAEGYTIDILILISQKSLMDLIQVITDVYQNEDVNFDLIGTGVNVDTFNYEAVMGTFVEVIE